MSLKAFHIVFIVVSTLLALLVGVWAVRGQAGAGAAVLGFGAAAVLVCYGIWFWRKLKHKGLQ